MSNSVKSFADAWLDFVDFKERQVMHGLQKASGSMCDVILCLLQSLTTAGGHMVADQIQACID